MALIVEDGSAKSDAQSYVSAADCVTYLIAVGATAFVALQAGAQEAAILRAMRFIEGAYREVWKGRRTTIDQALAWPRYGVKDQDGFLIPSTRIPPQLIHAVCEAAEREATAGTLEPDLARGGETVNETIKVGPIEESTTYRPDAPRSTTFPAIERLLSAFVFTGMTTKTYRT